MAVTESVFRALEEPLRTMVSWSECRLLTPPDPTEMTRDVWEEETRWWTQVREMACNADGSIHLDTDAQKQLWRLPAEAREVANVWVPSKNQDARLLFTWKKTDADPIEMDSVAGILKLTALLIAEARIPVAMTPPDRPELPTDGSAPFDLPRPGTWVPVKTRPGPVRLPDPPFLTEEQPAPCDLPLFGPRIRIKGRIGPVRLPDPIDD